MLDEFNIYDCSLINDVIAFYGELSNSGSIRYKTILNEFHLNLQDEDDNAFIYLGIALAYIDDGHKLPRVIKNKVLELIDSHILDDLFQENDKIIYDPWLEWKEKFKEIILNENYVLKKTTKSKKSIYLNWNLYDLYAYKLPENQFGLKEPGYVLLSVVEKHLDNKKIMPIVYLSFLPDFSLPIKDSNLEKMIFIPASVRYKHLGKLDFRFNMVEFPNEREEYPEFIFIKNMEGLKTPEIEYINPDFVFNAYMNPLYINDTLKIGIKILKSKCWTYDDR